MQDNLGSSWQFLYSAGLLSALICVLGNSPLQFCQHKFVCSLCKKSGKQWKWKKGDSVALCMNYLCAGELLLLIWWGFLPHFSFFVFVWYLLLHDFFSFSLSPCTSSFFPFHCICISLAHFLSFLSFSLLLPFLELVTFSPAFRNISLSLYFLSCFIRVCFSAVLTKLFLFLLSLPDLLCCALFCAAPFPLFPKSPPPLFPISGCRCHSCRNLRHSQNGGKHHMYHSHPESEGRRVLHVQVLGLWFLSTGCRSFV